MGRTVDEYLRSVATLNLPTEVVGRGFRVFDCIESTNTWTLNHGQEGLVVVADRQSAGRGRQGRTWLSAPGLGVWVSVCLEGIVPGLSFAAAMAVHGVLQPHRATVKWPNDVLIAGRKVCGILVEHRTGITALGIGINVHHTPQDFPDELRDRAGSLESTTGYVFDRIDVLARVLTALDESVILLRRGDLDRIRARWVHACDIVGKTVCRDGVPGVVKEIDAEGALVMETASGIRRFLSGDVTVVDGA